MHIPLTAGVVNTVFVVYIWYVKQVVGVYTFILIHILFFLFYFITAINGSVKTFVDVTIHEKKSKILDHRAFALNGSEISNKTLIVSTSDGFFLLQVFVKDTSAPGSYEGFLGVPIEQMLRLESNISVYEYIVATVCSAGGYCQFAISALSNNTQISIVFPEYLPEITICIGYLKFTTQGSTTITLHQFDAVQFESTLDFTGTHIYSYKPIAVFVGSRKRVSGDPSHTIEQLVPSTHWGQEVIVKASSTETLLLKIVSNYPNTLVHLDGSDKDFVITEQYQTVVRQLDSNGYAMVIKANQTIQVGYSFISVDNSTVHTLVKVL